MVQIRISDGILEGEMVQNIYGGSFYSFKSIPYAKPPIGDLRFKAPQPVEPWNYIRNAKDSGPESYQSDSFFQKKIFGQEDCLYLNVYTPDLKPYKSFPVMVWIHGGGFLSGSGNDDMYGPEFIVNKDVILVTINYRLGALGFLCLDTEEIPGNAGMKDQIAALRWVQNNIENFGGDPSNVTIFGESAGAACVSCHLISPMSVGLFKRAIIQSGSITNYWAKCQKPRDRALILAKKLGCFTENDEELAKFFKSLPVESLIQIKLPITASENFIEKIHLYFAIVDEKKFGNNERYFYENGLTLNIHQGVDVIIGYVEHEGIIGLKTDKDLSVILDHANFYPEYFAPKSMAFKTTVMEQLEMGKRIKKYYFREDIISIENLEQLVNFLTAELFVYGIIVFARFVAQSKKNKMYMYKFSCKSKRNIFTKIFGADNVLRNKTFVCHADDLGYLFPMEVLLEDVDMNSKEYEMIQTVTKLWTDFAKFGCPTPDKSAGVEWAPYTLKKQNYVNIAEKVIACEEPEKEDIIFWDKIHAHHFPHYAFYPKVMTKVKVAEGILEGVKETNKYGGEFYSFRGIPYAEPPIGHLRFKAPQSKKPWKGVRQARYHGSKCYQYEYIQNAIQGSEDCLYLNVYTPELQPDTPFPVMFWIHGGGLVSGSGNDNMYGPEFLVKQGVILVTINYRLEVLGFLCLHTKDIPGNAGMKDQVAALRWVQKNIRNFGGDPQNVTIFGESAGGGCVSFHCLSPMSKGLFKRAIIQSGCATSWLSNISMPRERAITLAKELGCTSENDDAIYAYFKNVSVHQLVNKKIHLTLLEISKKYIHSSFGVVKEEEFPDVERFFSENVYDAIRKGFHEGIDVINGYTENEGIIFLAGDRDMKEILSQANNYPEFFVPKAFELSYPISTQIEIGKKIKKYYFQNSKVSNDTMDQFLKFVSAESFIYPAILMQKTVAKLKKNKMYFYKFTCKSERNVFTQYIKVSDMFKNVTVVCHGDDLPYIFPFREINQEIEINSRAYKMIDKVTKLWTNFAKFGNPTPDGFKGLKWNPYTTEDEHFMDIGEDLKIGCSPDEEEVEFWNNIFKEYHPQISIQ
ncbi:uncharacterized protein LOC113400940 [Vanessa tameamea]|uniref:Uncharacterized protein LOC113400940 n=1 Tax=Vanessa tameamea TaxID=334116 RepID=A0ABM4AM58_VANTA